MAVQSSRLQAKPISRSKQQSAVASAAYRSGEKLEDKRIGETFDYTRKQAIEATRIMAPSPAPDWVMDRSQLWNTVEATEKRKDAQLAREVQVAIPEELPKDVREKLVWDFCQANFVDMGMIVDVAIHGPTKDNPRNWHWHGMLTMRTIGPDGFGLKERTWNENQHLERWKRNWEDACNAALEQIGSSTRVDMRAIEERYDEQVELASATRNWIKRRQHQIEAARLNYTARPNLPQKAYRAAAKGEVYPGYEDETAEWKAAIESRGVARNLAAVMQSALDFLLYLDHRDEDLHISDDVKAIHDWVLSKFMQDPVSLAMVAHFANEDPTRTLAECRTLASDRLDKMVLDPQHKAHAHMTTFEDAGEQLLSFGWVHITHLNNALRADPEVKALLAQSPEPIVDAEVLETMPEANAADTSLESDDNHLANNSTNLQAEDTLDKQNLQSAPDEAKEASDTVDLTPEPPAPSQSADSAQNARQDSKAERKARRAAEKAAQRLERPRNDRSAGKAFQNASETKTKPFLDRAVSWFTDKSRQVSDKATEQADKRKKSAWAKFIESYQALADTWSELHFAAHVNNRGKSEPETVKPLRAKVTAAIRTVLRGQKRHPVDQLTYDQILEERAAIKSTRGKINSFWISRAENTDDPWGAVDDKAMDPRDVDLSAAQRSPKHAVERGNASAAKRALEEQREREYQAEQARIKAEWDAGEPERLRRRQERYVDVAMPLIQRARTDRDFAYRIKKLGIDLDRPDDVVAHDLMWSMPVVNRDDEYVWYVLKKEAEAVDAKAAQQAEVQREQEPVKDEQAEAVPEPEAKPQSEQPKKSKPPSPSRNNTGFEP